MRGKWLLISISAILLAAAAGSISVLRRESAHRNAPAQPQLPPPLPPEVSLSGRIEARRVEPVTAEVSGNIEAFGADVGQDVYEGQVLARISNTGLETAHELAQTAVRNMQDRITKVEADLISGRLEASRAHADATRSRSQYDRLEKVYQRQKFLYSQGATPRLAYEKADREYQMAKSEYESLNELARQADEQVASLVSQVQDLKKLMDDKNKQLEDAKAGVQAAEVHSPVNGLVIARNGEVGKPASGDEHTPLFSIAVDLDQLRVVVEPEPPLLERIHPGQPAAVIVADVPGEDIPASVEEVKDQKVYVGFTSPTPALKPGMTAQVRIRIHN